MPLLSVFLKDYRFMRADEEDMGMDISREDTQLFSDDVLSRR